MTRRPPTAEEQIEAAAEALERAEAALDRNRGRITETDWRAQVERAEGRLLALCHARCEASSMA